MVRRNRQRIWSLMSFALLSAVVVTMAASVSAREQRPRSPETPAPERPREVWVFRCVLDEHPRMAVIALHEDLWVAYDATTCALYKAWTGGVKFDGAVYTAVHGPQPTSRGEAYANGPEGDVWQIIQGRSVFDATPVWQGYRLENGHITLRYALEVEGMDAIEIEETPEVRTGDDEDVIALERRFALSELPRGVQVRLRTDAGRVIDGEAGIETNGTFEAQEMPTDREGRAQDDSDADAADDQPKRPGWLTFRREGETTLGASYEVETLSVE